jgi:DNA polymerase elongation subunit (family B)
MILYNAQSRTVKDSSKIEFLRNLRIEAKKAHNKIRADALKVLINSIYGMSGDKYKKFYD